MESMHLDLGSLDGGEPGDMHLTRSLDAGAGGAPLPKLYHICEPWSDTATPATLSAQTTPRTRDIWEDQGISVGQRKYTTLDRRSSLDDRYQKDALRLSPVQSGIGSKTEGSRGLNNSLSDKYLDRTSSMTTSQTSIINTTKISRSGTGIVEKGSLEMMLADAKKADEEEDTTRSSPTMTDTEYRDLPTHLSGTLQDTPSLLPANSSKLADREVEFFNSHGPSRRPGTHAPNTAFETSSPKCYDSKSKDAGVAGDDLSERVKSLMEQTAYMDEPFSSWQNASPKSFDYDALKQDLADIESRLRATRMGWTEGADQRKTQSMLNIQGDLGSSPTAHSPTETGLGGGGRSNSYTELGVSSGGVSYHGLKWDYAADIASAREENGERAGSVGAGLGVGQLKMSVSQHSFVSSPDPEDEETERRIKGRYSLAREESKTEERSRYQHLSLSAELTEVRSPSPSRVSRSSPSFAAVAFRRDASPEEGLRRSKEDLDTTIKGQVAAAKSDLGLGEKTPLDENKGREREGPPSRSNNSALENGGGAPNARWNRLNLNGGGDSSRSEEENTNTGRSQRSGTARSTTTVESTHVGSDDAVGPEFSPHAYGSRGEPIDCSSSSGIYAKSKLGQGRIKPSPLKSSGEPEKSPRSSGKTNFRAALFTYDRETSKDQGPSLGELPSRQPRQHSSPHMFRGNSPGLETISSRDTLDDPLAFDSLKNSAVDFAETRGNGLLESGGHKKTKRNIEEMSKEEILSSLQEKWDRFKTMVRSDKRGPLPPHSMGDFADLLRNPVKRLLADSDWPRRYHANDQWAVRVIQHTGPNKTGYYAGKYRSNPGGMLVATGSSGSDGARKGSYGQAARSRGVQTSGQTYSNGNGNGTGAGTNGNNGGRRGNSDDGDDDDDKRRRRRNLRSKGEDDKEEDDDDDDEEEEEESVSHTDDRAVTETEEVTSSIDTVQLLARMTRLMSEGDEQEKGHREEAGRPDDSFDDSTGDLRASEVNPLHTRSTNNTRHPMGYESAYPRDPELLRLKHLVLKQKEKWIEEKKRAEVRKLKIRRLQDLVEQRKTGAHVSIPSHLDTDTASAMSEDSQSTLEDLGQDEELAEQAAARVLSKIESPDPPTPRASPIPERREHRRRQEDKSDKAPIKKAEPRPPSEPTSHGGRIGTLPANTAPFCIQVYPQSRAWDIPPPDPKRLDRRTSAEEVVEDYEKTKKDRERSLVAARTRYRPSTCANKENTKSGGRKKRKKKKRPVPAQSKISVESVNEGFLDNARESTDKKGEPRVAGGGLSWYFPVEKGRGSRRSGRGRRVLSDLEPRAGEGGSDGDEEEADMRTSWDVSLVEDDKDDRETHESQLRSVFESRMTRFISRSRERQKRVRLAGEERRYVSHMDAERTRLFAGEVVGGGRRVTYPDPLVAKQQRSYSSKAENLHKPKKRSFSHEQMRAQSAKVYRNLPEVQERYLQERTQARVQNNRLRMQLYGEKVLRAVLRQRGPWVATFQG